MHHHFLPSQVALHMLSCIDTVTWAHESGLTVVENDLQTVTTVRIYTREDFTPVNRFESMSCIPGHQTRK